MARPSQSKLRGEIEELRLRLEEAEQALEAIRTGQVESLVVEGPDGPRIFSLEGATQSYRFLVESMNEGAVTLREDGTVLYCNARFAEMLGEPLQKVMGSSLREHVPERSRDAFDALLERARESAVREEVPLRAFNGDEIPAYLSVSSIVDDGRRVLCVVATDLREQKRTEEIAAAEKAARESEGRLRLALQAGGGGTWDFDLANNGAWWSPEMYEMFGVQLGTGMQLDNTLPLIHEEDRQRVLQAVKESIEHRKDYRCDFRIRHPIRGERWLSSQARLVCDESGKPVRMHGITFDITGRKRAEEALREADRRKDEFLGMLSHELRNPLAPIRNSTYILRHARPGSEQAQRAQNVIERQTQHLTRLVDDLLDVTRIARGKIELRRERVDLRDVVRRTAEDHRSVIESRGVTFRVDVPGANVWVDIDQTRLAQAIGNLLQNAAKFTRQGDSVMLSVEFDGTTADIRVEDSGSGIDAELLPRLFTAFVQGERTLARTQGGLGLGLAHVKGIVELHGGTVSAESAGTGHGSQFTIRLPVAGRAVAAQRSLASEPRSFTGRRVLVVDDNVDAAESLAETLKLAGHEVEVAFDGPTAIDKARLNPPDVVLCDIGLPGMSGYEVARRLRASGANGMQLIAVTGYAQPEDVKNAVDAGFDGHVAKPCDPEEIERLLS
jgi:PAS domain S-box-containing protein